MPRNRLRVCTARHLLPAKTGTTYLPQNTREASYAIFRIPAYGCSSSVLITKKPLGPVLDKTKSLFLDCKHFLCSFCKKLGYVN